MKWKCFIPGKPGTDWEGGFYPLSMEFSEDYPTKPPKVRARAFECSCAAGRERDPAAWPRGTQPAAAGGRARASPRRRSRITPCRAPACAALAPPALPRSASSLAASSTQTFTPRAPCA